MKAASSIFDELHHGGGRQGEGAMDAGNMLKPALARGTALHWRHHPGRIPQSTWRKDAALERRFQKVLVDTFGGSTIAIPAACGEIRGCTMAWRITDRPSSPPAELSNRHHRPLPAG